jgi:hypothetical protein
MGMKPPPRCDLQTGLEGDLQSSLARLHEAYMAIVL